MVRSAKPDMWVRIPPSTPLLYGKYMIEKYVMLRQPDTNVFNFPFCRVKNLHKQVSDEALRNYHLLKIYTKETHILYEYCHKVCIKDILKLVDFYFI